MKLYLKSWQFFRKEKETLLKLRESFNDTSKDERHRRNLISIHITILHWVVEFIGFGLIIIGTFFLGHGNAIVTLTLQTWTIFIFFNLLPCVFLLNDSDLKSDIAENKYYFKFLKTFNCEKYRG